MTPDELYRFLDFTREKWSLDGLSTTSFPAEIQGLLAVIGLPKTDLLECLVFEPWIIYEPEEIGDMSYYRLGALSLNDAFAEVFIDTTHWHVWAHIWSNNPEIKINTSKIEVQFLNSDLSSFLLFMETYAYSILTNYAQKETGELLIKQYTQLKTQFEAIDSRSLLNKDNMWAVLLTEIKHLYESYG